MKINFKLINKTAELIILAITVGCSSSSLPIPKPPQDLKYPAVNQARPSSNKSTSNIAIIPNKEKHEESAGEFKKFEEKRSNGGTVTEIKVNNRSDLPSYYLYPEQPQNQNLNINNQQRNISAPTWQLKW